MASEAVIKAINESPLNRGLEGSAWAANPLNIAIERGDDIALFDWCDEGTYEVHFLFQSRGKAAVAAAREAFRRMFEDHGAELILGLVPDILPQAKIIARKAGGKYAGKQMTEFGECELYVLSKEMWKGEDQ
jgi:hypothetical protein